VDASLRDRPASALPQQVVAYLQDAHAIETQAVQSLKVAPQFADAETVAVARLIAAQERAAAERIAGTWDTAMDAALEKVGVPAS